MKRLITVFFAAVLLLALVPSIVFAANSEPCSLTVIMKRGEEMLKGIEVAVCLVAGAKEESYAAEPAFSGAGADFAGVGYYADTQTKEKNIALAASLNTYALDKSIARSVKVTDSAGKAVYAGLSSGLYLVAQVNGENSEYIIAPYLVAIPAQRQTRDGWDYDVIAYPKSEPVKRGAEPPGDPPGNPPPPGTPEPLDTPNNLSTPNPQTNPNVPKTEDTSNARLWIMLIAFGFAGLLAVLLAANAKRMSRVSRMFTRG